MFRRIKKLFSIIILALLVVAVFRSIKEISFAINNIKSNGEIIVIDAGHGGKDPGTVSSSGIYEKDINLNISKKLIKKLESQGYRVISTRDNDNYIENIERAKLANKENARIFISIHCNAAENNSSIYGAQVLYYPNKENNLENISNSQRAQLILDSIIDKTGAENRGIIEREDLTVLKTTNMPALIIEAGFLSNLNEERLLIKDSYQNKIVDGVVEGLESYFILRKE